MFMERASSQVIANNIAAGDFRSSGGFRWNNSNWWVGAYATGPTSGTIHSGTVQSEQLGGVARIAWQVYQDKDYSFHIGGNYENLFKPASVRSLLSGVALTPQGAQALTLNDRPELRIDPTQLISTTIPFVSGAQVYGAEGAAQLGPLFFQGEYFHYNIDRQSATGLPSLKFDGYYAEAAWSLTGEKRGYNAAAGAYGGIVPAHPFSSHGGSCDWFAWDLHVLNCGAWEIAARYSVMDLNDLLGVPNVLVPGVVPSSTAAGAAGGKQTVWTAGLNWYATRNVRFTFNYLHGDVDRQSSTTNTADVGSKFDAFAVRTQVAF